MDALLFVTLLGFSTALAFLAVYSDSPGVLGLAGVFMLVIASSLFLGPVVETKTLALSNTTTTVTTALDFPFRQSVAVVFLALSLYLLGAAAFSVRTRRYADEI